ncbi:MAG: ATP-binding cassette domain-containing protein, partial [Pseudomonadota bacterium]
MGFDSSDQSIASGTRVTTPAISVRNVIKRYGMVTALKGASLEIHDNEFFTLLGPSGCGKTTLLRL